MSRLSRYNLLISSVRRELECSHVLNSAPASKHNELMLRRGVEAWIFLSDDIMSQCDVTLQGRDTRLRTLLRLVNNHDFSCILSALKEIYDLLIEKISGKIVVDNYGDFKGLLSTNCLSFFGLLTSPIKEPLMNVILSKTVVSMDCYHNSSTHDMWRCAHYLLFLTKLNFESVGLEEKALKDYLSFEQETASFQPLLASKYIPALQTILADWLEEWQYEGDLFQHGPGSVADSRRFKIDKYQSLAPNASISYLYGGNNVMSTIPNLGDSPHPLDKCSKLVFVPKNVTKLRSISMEPATLQYYQQGCMLSLMKYFRESSKLRKILKLSDQSQNKSLAYQGSITDDYATIDLSHASDSVNYLLALELFKKVPKLRRWMVCTRSTHTMLPDGHKLCLSKFAPMGSSLCFPIESLIFAAIAQLAIHLSNEEALDRNNETGIRNSLRFFSVYGDDIILPSYAGKKCIKLLIAFGFFPNREKSYLHGPFKESCGGNFFCGHDITALKYTPKFHEDYPLGISPSAYSALCNYANLAFLRDLRLFRLYCIKLIFESGLKPLFVDNFEQSPGIFSPTPTNFHLKKKWIGLDKRTGTNYQKFVFLYTNVQTVSCQPTQANLERYSHIFYFDYLLGRSRFEYDGYLESNNSRVSNRVLLFDVRERYSPSTLLENKLRFSLCAQDA